MYDNQTYLEKQKNNPHHTFIISIFISLIILFIISIMFYPNIKTQPTETIKQSCVKNVYDTLNHKINYYKKLIDNFDTCKSSDSWDDVIYKTKTYSDSLIKPYILITKYKNEYIQDYGTLDELLKIKKFRYNEMLKKSTIIDSIENIEKTKFKELNTPLK